MDIKKYAVLGTGRLHLRDSDDQLMYADGDDGKPDMSKPMAVNLYGPGSKQFAKAQSDQNNRITEQLRRKGKALRTAEQKAAEAAEFLADCTQSWENVDYGTLTGEALSKAVYSDIEIGFIADQVNKHLNDWANFTKGSTTS